MDLSSLSRTGTLSGNGPVRTRKEPTLIQTIAGVGIGFLLVLASPLLMWSAQSQHRAKDFKSATVVSTEGGASGYITTMGAPAYVETDGGADCLEGSCLYQKEAEQELVTRTELLCADNVQESATLRILARNGSECDSDGSNCVPCYDVEKDSWETQKTIVSLYDVTLGGYTITPTETAIYLDTSERTIETGVAASGRKSQSVYTWFPLPTRLLVTGDSTGTSIAPPAEKVFVLSAYDVEGTLLKLKDLDRSSMLALFLGTFIALVVGYSLILGPLSWAGRQLGFIPVVGSLLKGGSKFLVLLAAILLAIPSWIIIFLLVTVLKFWWLALLAIILGAGFFLYKAKSTPPAAV